nr:hypothetical protein [uncultured Aurantimicrobium sp.]
MEKDFISAVVLPATTLAVTAGVLVPKRDWPEEVVSQKFLPVKGMVVPDANEAWLSDVPTNPPFSEVPVTKPVEYEFLIVVVESYNKFLPTSPPTLYCPVTAPVA